MTSTQKHTDAAYQTDRYNTPLGSTRIMPLVSYTGQHREMLISVRPKGSCITPMWWTRGVGPVKEHGMLDTIEKRNIESAYS